MVMTVNLIMKDGTVLRLPNITEIHYNYPSATGETRVAFESDILGEGCTHSILDIKEFEAISEREAYVGNMFDLNALILKEMGIDMTQYLKYALKVMNDVQRLTTKASEMDTT